MDSGWRVDTVWRQMFTQAPPLRGPLILHSRAGAYTEPHMACPRDLPSPEHGLQDRRDDARTAATPHAHAQLAILLHDEGAHGTEGLLPWPAAWGDMHKVQEFDL